MQSWAGACVDCEILVFGPDPDGMYVSACVWLHVPVQPLAPSPDVHSSPSVTCQLLTGPLSPNESFLRYLTLPQDNELAIDLRQTAVVVMAHLDRLATPCMPPLCSSPTSHKVSAPAPHSRAPWDSQLKPHGVGAIG